MKTHIIKLTASNSIVHFNEHYIQIHNNRGGTITSACRMAIKLKYAEDKDLVEIWRKDTLCFDALPVGHWANWSFLESDAPLVKRKYRPVDVAVGVKE